MQVFKAECRVGSHRRTAIRQRWACSCWPTSLWKHSATQGPRHTKNNRGLWSSWRSGGKIWLEMARRKFFYLLSCMCLSPRHTRLYGTPDFLHALIHTGLPSPSSNLYRLNSNTLPDATTIKSTRTSRFVQSPNCPITHGTFNVK